MSSKEEQLRIRVAKFYTGPAAGNKKVTKDHFVVEGVPKSTVYSIIRTFEDRGDVKRKSGSGRESLSKGRKLEELGDMSDNKNSTSIKAAAKRFDCERSTIRQTLKDNFDISAKKRKIVPKFDKASEKINKTMCRRLKSQFSRKSIIQTMRSILV